MDAIVVQCPGCQAKLKLKNRNTIGKKVPCPKCHQPFVVKPLQKPDDEFGFGDGLDEGLEEDFQAPAPPPVSRGRRPGSKAKGRSKRIRRTEWKKPALIGGIGLVGILLIGGLIWMVVGLLSGPGAVSGGTLAYLPPDAEVIISCRLAEIWKAPILQPLLSNPNVNEQIAELRKQIGLGPDDVESIVVAVADLSAMQASGSQQAGMPPMGGGFMPSPSLDVSSGVIVIRTAKPFEEQKLINYARDSEDTPFGELEEASHAGESYYRAATPEGDDSQYAAVFFADDQTIVLGPEDDVKSAIDRGADGQDRPELNFVDFDQHLVFAAVPKDPKSLSKQTWSPSDTAPESVKKLKQALEGTLKAGSFGLTFTEGIDFQMQWDCVDTQASEQIAALVDEVMADVHKEFDAKISEAKATAPTPLLAELVDVGKQVLDSIQAEQTGTTVAVTAALPSSARDTFGKIPEAIASAFQPPDFTAMSEEFGEEDMSEQFGEKGTTSFETESPFLPAEKEPAPSLEGVNLDAFNAAWQTQLDVQDRPAGELLRQIADELGLKLEPEPGQEAALNKPVTLKLDGSSRLAAIDQICEQIGMYPHFSEMAPDTIALKKRPRPWPTTSAGPFLIDVVALRENVPYATGNLQIRILAAGLPSSLSAKWQDDTTELAEFTQIADAQQNSLIDTVARSSAGMGQPSSVFRQDLHISLKNLLKSVDAIKVLKGHLRFSIPTNVEVLKFDQLKEGQTQTAGDVRITLSRVKLGGQTQLEFQVEGAKKDDIEITAYDAEHGPLESISSGWSGFGDKASADLWLEGQAKSVEVRVITSVEDVEYTFALPEIVLPSHDQMPDKLEPIQFTGSEPATCKFVKFTGDENFRKVVFEVANHANKDISNVSLTLSYLDANGKTLKESPQMVSFFRSPLGKGATQEEEVSAFFMPDGTKSVSARATRVKFADASVWQP